MPIYEYLCEDCGHRSEELQKMGARPLRKCPSCGGKYSKQISAPSFQFKGTGWYVTDYARKDGGSGGDTKGESQEKSKGDAAKRARRRRRTPRAIRRRRNRRAIAGARPIRRSSLM